MQITIAIALYVLGCVLAYGRLNGQRIENKELYGVLEDVKWFAGDILLICLSWFTFLLSLITWFKGWDKYFLKF